MKILFLDDNLRRHSRLADFIQYTPAWTAQEAISLLKNNYYDLVMLDHDLGGNEYVDSFGKEETGYTVLKWIIDNDWENIGRIIVHSHNHIGVKNMLDYHKNSGCTIPISFTAFITMSVDEFTFLQDYKYSKEA